MNGKILADTPIAVDCWQLRKCHHVRLFFLSHMHADHTAGLSSTWSHRSIYCSPLTARLLHRKLGVKEKWICPLELGESHMLMLDDLGKERLVVTLIDANHCPGAVMFLFEGYFGTRLYTGDFRYTPAMLREQCLRNNTTIDVLYLDNTNCDPTRAVPSRQRATQQIKEIIRTHPGHVVVFGLYSLGKESLLVELAMEFKSWVEVDVDRLETLRVLGLPDVFTTEPGSGRFRVVSQSEVNGSNLLTWNKEHPTIAILPTSRPIVSCHRNVHVVPYSDHSSYQELEDFVSALRPSSMVPIVGSCLPYFSSLLSPCKKTKKVYIPESVKLYMTRSDGHHRAGVKQGLPERSTCSESRGVVFESPLSKRGPEDQDSDDSEADHNSDCILSNLTPDSSRARKRLKLTSVASEDVVTLSSCVSPDDESHDGESELLEVVTSRIKKVSNGLHVGSAISREKCCSMDSISTHDQTGLAASTLPEKKSRSACFTLTLPRDQLEQWLLNNTTVPEEELKCEQVMQGLQEEFPLMPDHLPKVPCDPLQAAIRRLL